MMQDIEVFKDASAPIPCDVPEISHNSFEGPKLPSKPKGKRSCQRDYYAPRTEKRVCSSSGTQLSKFRSCSRLYDDYERRSLKEQARAISQMRTAPYNGYSRGPEILEAMKKLRSGALSS